MKSLTEFCIGIGSVGEVEKGEVDKTRFYDSDRLPCLEVRSGPIIIPQVMGVYQTKVVVRSEKDLPSDVWESQKEIDSNDERCVQKVCELARRNGESVPADSSLIAVGYDPIIFSGFTSINEFPQRVRIFPIQTPIDFNYKDILGISEMYRLKEANLTRENWEAFKSYLFDQCERFGLTLPEMCLLENGN